VRRASARAAAATDYAAAASLGRLRPGTRYFYRAWFSDRSKGESGSFRTAPSKDRSAPVRFVFGGDVGGGRYCRHRLWGLPAFFYMTVVKPDFFVALGDMIYADESCPATGPNGWENIPADFPVVDDPGVDWNDRDRVREVYRRHWRYFRADRHVQYLLGRTALYSIWDDHEVINDFGGSWAYWNAESERRGGYRNLVDAGRDALFAYGGIRRRAKDPNRIHRSFRWGKNLHLVLTDARSYRSRNDQPDRADRPKTMLGRPQLAWLKETLHRSRATWKVVACDVPLSVPTGNTTLGRDSWANGDHSTGFERELLDLLRFLDARNIRNVVFITADLHFAQTLRYDKDFNGDGDRLQFHELIVGPLNARLQSPSWLDGTAAPKSLYSEGSFFNFGVIDVRRDKTGRARLRAEVRDSSGNLRPPSVLTLIPH
jgi:alkaline phosphatase D